MVSSISHQQLWTANSGETSGMERPSTKANVYVNGESQENNDIHTKHWDRERIPEREPNGHRRVSR